jgi:Uma2 family endonuclease
MATMTQVATSGDQRIVLYGVSWETYQALRHTDESRRGSVRMTYDRGRLILMSPSQEHEQHAERLGLMIRMAALGMGLNCMGVGRMTHPFQVKELFCNLELLLSLNHSP